MDRVRRRARSRSFRATRRAGLQVWSGDTGYPADGNYLDFHKKRWPGGLQYWQVTQAQSDMALKHPYFPEEAIARTRAHADHFAALVYDALKDGFDAQRPPVLASLFDAELFGHWWFEGPVWLEQVARIFSREDFPVALVTGKEYLTKVSRDRLDQAWRRLMGQERQQRSLAERSDQLDLDPHLPRRAGDARGSKRRPLARWQLGGCAWHGSWPANCSCWNLPTGNS